MRAIVAGLRLIRPPVSAYCVPLAIAECLVHVARLQDRDDGPEALSSCAITASGVDVGEDVRADVEAALGQPPRGGPVTSTGRPSRLPCSM